MNIFATKLQTNHHILIMLHKRIENLMQLRNLLLQSNDEFKQIKEKAERENGWFIQPFIEKSIENICNNYLDENNLILYAASILTSEQKNKVQTIGVTMAGNIPLVGFHDFLSVYLCGHQQKIKLSSKDNILLPYIIDCLYKIDPISKDIISIENMLKNCDAYIATGSNSSAMYFEKYFSKYPHIIRKNKTSVAVLTGDETGNDLEKLADDVYLYFGLGCRNITKIFVPQQYNFEQLLNVFQKYDELKHHNKYRNNYDYNLALYILNNQFYMTNESLLLIENKNNFSAVSTLHFEYYKDEISIQNKEEIQAIVGAEFIPFGEAQSPTLFDFADGVNTIEFLNSL